MCRGSQGGKGGRVGATRVAQHKALPVEPEGKGRNEAAAAHAAHLGDEHGAGGGERQPAGLEVLQMTSACMMR